MSFFTKREEKKKQATISHNALFSYDGSKCSYILNDEYRLIRTLSENGQETISEPLTNCGNEEELKVKIADFTVASTSEMRQSALTQFKDNVYKTVMMQLVGNQLCNKSLEEKYNLVLKGICNYIPSSMLEQYEGTDEQKILLFLQERYPV